MNEKTQVVEGKRRRYWKQTFAQTIKEKKLACWQWGKRKIQGQLLIWEMLCLRELGKDNFHKKEFQITSTLNIVQESPVKIPIV